MASAVPQSVWGRQPSIATATNAPVTPSNPSNNQANTSSNAQSNNQSNTPSNNQSNKQNDGKKKQQNQSSPRNNQPHHQTNKQPHNNQSAHQKPKSSHSAPSPSNSSKQPVQQSNTQSNTQSTSQSKEPSVSQPKETVTSQPKDQPKEQSKEATVTQSTDKPSSAPSAVPATKSSATPSSASATSQSTTQSAAPAGTQFAPSSQSELTQYLQIGNRVQVLTSTGVVNTGDVFVYDQESQSLALETIKQSNNQETRDWSLYNARNIKVTLVKKADNSTHRSLHRVDQPRLIAKEAKAIADRQAAAAKIGHGVSTEGQRLFDVLAKLFPARWEDTTIVLMDAIRLDSPYDRKSLSGGTAQQQQRIVKIIEAERAKMGLQ